jgi:hypothetical protein
VDTFRAIIKQSSSMDEFTKTLTRFNPTDEQKIELIKLVMNHKQPVKPDGVQNAKEDSVTWESNGSTIKLWHNKPQPPNPISPYTVEVSDATGQMQWRVYMNDQNRDFAQFFYLGDEQVRVEYTIRQNTISHTKYIDEVSRKSPHQTIQIVETSTTTRTDGSVPKASLLYKKYEELKSRTIYPNTLSDVTSPEVVSQVNAWLSYLIATT